MAASASRRSSDGTAEPIDRVTVTLIPRVADDLQKLQDRTGLSKTDLVNRAITLYEFIDQELSTGRDLLVRDKASGETQVIRLLLWVEQVRHLRSRPGYVTASSRTSEWRRRGSRGWDGCGRAGCIRPRKSRWTIGSQA